MPGSLDGNGEGIVWNMLEAGKTLARKSAVMESAEDELLRGNLGRSGIYRRRRDGNLQDLSP